MSSSPARAAIYRKRYWDAQRCNELPAGVDYSVFDYGVNSGIGRSGKVLRRVVGLPDTTHVVTDEVLRAVAKRNPKALAIAINDERLAFLKRLKTWPVFGKGWGARVAAVKSVSLRLAAQQAPAPSIAPDAASVPGKGVVPAPAAAKKVIVGTGTAAPVAAGGIFGPGIANGLISGGPQLGAGAAVGTALAAGGIGVAGALGARAGAGAIAGAMRGGIAMTSGAASTYRTSAAASGATGAKAAAAGAAGVTRAGATAIADRFGEIMRSSSSGASSTSSTGASAIPPEWAQRLRRHQTMVHGASVAAHSVGSGDHGSGGTSISLSEYRR